MTELTNELLKAAKAAHQWFEDNHSDTDFDMDAGLANVHADLHIAIYNFEKENPSEYSVIEKSFTLCPIGYFPSVEFFVINLTHN